MVRLLLKSALIVTFLSLSKISPLVCPKIQTIQNEDIIGEVKVKVEQALP